MRRLLMLAPIAALAACQNTPEPVTNADLTPNCQAEQFQQLVGKSADALNNVTLPAGVRILRPNMPATLDYRSNRMNVVIDEQNKIERINCG